MVKMIIYHYDHKPIATNHRGYNHIKLIQPLKTDWWFGTFLICFHILGISSSQLTNSIIFQRGRYTTNQIIIPLLTTINPLLTTINHHDQWLGGDRSRRDRSQSGFASRTYLESGGARSLRRFEKATTMEQQGWGEKPYEHGEFICI